MKNKFMSFISMGAGNYMLLSLFLSVLVPADMVA